MVTGSEGSNSMSTVREQSNSFHGCIPIMLAGLLLACSWQLSFAQEKTGSTPGTRESNFSASKKPSWSGVASPEDPQKAGHASNGPQPTSSDSRLAPPSNSNQRHSTPHPIKSKTTDPATSKIGAAPKLTNPIEWRKFFRI